MKVKEIEWESAFEDTCLRGKVDGKWVYCLEIMDDALLAECHIGNHALFTKMFKSQCITRSFKDICQDHLQQCMEELDNEDK